MQRFLQLWYITTLWQIECVTVDFRSAAQQAICTRIGQVPWWDRTILCSMEIGKFVAETKDWWLSRKVFSTS